MSGFTGLSAVFRREFKGYFSSPVGYVFCLIFMYLACGFALSRDMGRFFDLRVATLSGYFQYIPLLLIGYVPAIAMRLWSEERKGGTIELLLTLPITLRASYVGKFLAAWSFVVFSMTLSLLPMLFLVFRYGEPDANVIASSYFASILLTAAFLAISMFFSALTKSQTVAFIMSATFCFAFYVIGTPQVLDGVGSVFPYLRQLLAAISIEDNFETMIQGVVQFRAVFFLVVLTLVWLFGGMVVLQQRKAA